MKSGTVHRVPLSDEALAVIERMRALRGPAGWLFPSPRKAGRPLAETSLRDAAADMGLTERGTIHGLGSSFRDWCADTGQPRELAEAALAHVVGGVEGAYFRSDLIERRRELMTAWAKHCAGR